MHRGYSVYTSNVDGQFQKADFDQTAIHECRGTLHHLQCLDHCSGAIWDADGLAPVVDEEQCLLLNSPSTCPSCGGLARPNVLMFSDSDCILHRAPLSGALQRVPQQAGEGVRLFVPVSRRD